MCYLLASRRPELFAALGPVAGFMSVEILRRDDNPHPVPLFEIHGTEDRTTRWEGDLENQRRLGRLPPDPDGRQLLGRKEQMPPGADRHASRRGRRPPGHRPPLHRGEPTAARCGSTKRSATHSWHDTGVDTCEELWRFFSRATCSENPPAKPAGEKTKKGFRSCGAEPFICNATVSS